MKKIISLVVVAFMALSLSTVAFAADTITYTAEDVTLNVGAADKTAVVNVKFTMPSEIGLIGFQPEIAFDKTALTLTAYELSGEGVTWSTTDCNLNQAYGAYLSFDDTDYVGTNPATEYVLKLTFTVNDVSVANEESVSLQALALTTSEYASVDDVGAPVFGEICKIKVAPAGPTKAPIDVTVEKLVGEVTEKQDYAYAADITVEGAPTQLIWSVLKDDARKYSAAQPVAGVAGNVKVGFVSENNYDENTMGVLLTNEAEDTIWYSVEADLANEAE